MTAMEFAGLATVLTGVASVIAAIGSAIAAVLAAKNSQKIEQVRKATNGMNQELVKANGDKMYAQGLKHGQEGGRGPKPKKPPLKKKRKVKRLF